MVVMEKTNPTKSSPFIVSNDMFSKEYWEGIVQCKELFVKKDISPLNSPYLRKEVAESWIRSKKYGVCPWGTYEDYRLTEEELEQAREQNKQLIEVAQPLISNYLELASRHGHSLELFDPSGVFLLGIHVNLSLDPVLAVVFNESTTGTTSHGLATYLKKPVQLIGPENYLDVWRNFICSAAPILNEENEVLGTLALIQDLGDRPWEKDPVKLHAHSLGWVSSLAVAIEKQLKLRNSYDSLSEVNKNLRKATETLKVTLEFIDEGVITIDPDGTIIRSNQEGSRIFNLNHDEMKGRKITDFLSPKSNLLDLVTKKKTVDYMEEYIVVGEEEKPYLVSVKPVKKQDTDELDFAILRFNHSDKINALVTSRSGATAKFSFDDIIGESVSMLKAKSLARRFAKSLDNVLLLGESGTGKELFAQAIHNSSRPGGPFIAVNCAAMPRNLIESELFGYESGAFTGAEKNGRPGKIELANGGTLFLDEIGDMPFELQAVILRVLQDKMVMRLGGKNYRQVNFRLITATNQNLQHLIQEKKFREDLYFRLSVLNIDIPPLRDRGYDIAILAEYFIKNYAEKMGLPVPTISDEAKEKILQYNWPGNVRQLENAIIYAVNLAEDNIIEVQHLPKELVERTEISPPSGSEAVAPPTNNVPSDTKGEELFSMEESEKMAIQKAMNRAGNNVAIASKLLGISKTTLYRKLKKHNIDF